MQGDKVVHSAKKAKPKDHIKGCPGNDGKAHLYAAEKKIYIYSKSDHTYTRYIVNCVFCMKHRRTPLKISSDVVVDKTTVTVYGEYVRTDSWKTSGYRVIKTKTYNGNTDRNGNETS